MTLACVLLRKGIYIIDKLNESFHKKENYFNDQYFDKFLLT
jgi:hypothetical protein